MKAKYELFLYIEVQEFQNVRKSVERSLGILLVILFMA